MTFFDPEQVVREIERALKDGRVVRMPVSRGQAAEIDRVLSGRPRHEAEKIRKSLAIVESLASLP